MTAGSFAANVSLGNVSHDCQQIALGNGIGADVCKVGTVRWSHLWKMPVAVARRLLMAVELVMVAAKAGSTCQCWCEMPVLIDRKWFFAA